MRVERGGGLKVAELEQPYSRLSLSVYRGYVEEMVRIPGSHGSRHIYRARICARCDGLWWLQQLKEDRRSERWNLARWRELES